MDAPRAVVFVVDNDPSVCKVLTHLLRSVGLTVQPYASALEFLGAERPEVPSCLVLEVRLPDLSGPELQHQLAAAQVALPLIFLTAHGTIPLAVRAMKAGAREFLCKPVHEQELLAAIQQAIEQDRTVRPHRAALSPLQLRYDALTPRERQVLPLVTSGLVNKQVGEKLGRSERTINVHRAAVMDEMGADSLADLVRMARRLDTVATEA